MGSWDYLASSLPKMRHTMLFPPLLPQMEKMKNPKFLGTSTCTCLSSCLPRHRPKVNMVTLLMSMACCLWSRRAEVPGDYQ